MKYSNASFDLQKCLFENKFLGFQSALKGYLDIAWYVTKMRVKVIRIVPFKNFNVNKHQGS